MTFEYDLALMSAVIFLPTLFALILLFFPKGSEEYMRWWSLLGTAVTLVASLYLLIDFRADVVDRHLGAAAQTESSSLLARARAAEQTSVAPAKPTHDWLARRPWIGGGFNIDYYLGVDGISMSLILLTTILSFLAMIASWNIERFVKGYCALFLILETGMLGTFLALDFFLFYIFWEVMLLPMYFLIGVWGGPRREYAAIKFFLYTLLGSVFILIALLGFYFTDIRDFLPGAPTNGNSFDLVRLQQAGKTAMELLGGADPEKVAEQLVRKQSLTRNISAEDRQEAIASAKLTSEERAALKRSLGNERIRRAAIDAEPLRPDQQEQLRQAKAKQEKKEALTEQERTVVRSQERFDRAQKAANDIKPLSEEEQTFLAAADVKIDTAARERLIKEQVPAAAARLKDQLFFNSPAFQITMFLLLFVGFAIKVPVFPFHTWLPDAHVEAPTPISMILAGVLLKLGGYGIIRIAYPICPWAAMTLAWYVALFGVINIVYGAFAAMAQTDFKKLVAYSSISHMGYVLLGIAVWAAAPDAQYWAWGMNGAMFQMIAHGITSAGMFFLVGVIYDRAHHRNLNNFRGLYEPMPLYGGISAVIFFAAMGLPSMCGFVGEFMVILSTWNYSKLFAILAALTVVLTAAYILWTLQRVYLGQNAAHKDYPDITLRELICIIPLVVLAIALGIWPQQLLLSWMEPTVTGLVKFLAQVGLS